MQIRVSAQVLLVVAIVLLAANLVLMVAVHGAAPAQAQAAEKTCVGLAAAGEGDQWTVYRAWSDGTVDVRSGKAHRISF